MNIVRAILAISFLLIVGCKSKADQLTVDIQKIENEIQQLTTEDVKRIYLEQILEDDQAVRNGNQGGELMLKYGKDSKEFMDYVKAMWDKDKINLIKVEKNLAIHGYPDKEMGDLATTAPWMTIHHAQEYEARERNFEMIYDAYLTGKIDEGAISFYLGRMYEMKHGERLKMESPYKMQDEINQLIDELGLEERKAKIQGPELEKKYN